MNYEYSWTSFVTTMLFFVGIVEMVIASLWTRYVSAGKKYIGGLITFVNIYIWYFVLRTVLENINNTTIVFVYAVGCAIGTVIGTGLRLGGKT